MSYWFMVIGYQLRRSSYRESAISKYAKHFLPDN